MAIKEVFRSITIYLLGIGLVLVLLSLAYSLLFVNVGAQPEKIKQILRNSDIYHKIAPVMYDEALKPNIKADEGIPIKNPAVRQAFLEAFDPGFVQNNVESVIDGTYDWLEGRADHPDFVIDFTGAKRDFANTLDKHIVKRTKKLPVCSQKQLAKLKLDDINLLTVPCVPPSVNVKALRADLTGSITKNDDFLAKVDPATFKDDSGRPLFETLENTPKTFQVSKKLPIILLVLATVISLAVVFISKTRREGIKKLGKFFLVSGIFVVLAPLSLILISNLLLDSAREGSIAAELINPLAGEINKAIAQVYLLNGLFYILLAVGAFVYLRKTAPKTGKKEKK